MSKAIKKDSTKVLIHGQPAEEECRRPKEVFYLGKPPAHLAASFYCEPFYCRYCNVVVYGLWNNKRHKGWGWGKPSKLHHLLREDAMQDLYKIIRKNGF